MATKEAEKYTDGTWVFSWNVDNYVKGQSPKPGDYTQEQLEDFIKKGQLVRKQG